MSVISKTFKISGNLTDMTTVKLSDPTGTYGVRRADTGDVVVADDTSMDYVSTGTYRYEFTDPAENLTYEYYLEYVYNGETHWIKGSFTMPVSVVSFTTDIGKVRALINDIDPSNYVLTDNQIQVYLDLTSNNLYQSSALALRAIASSKALLHKMISAGDYKEDSKGMAKALMDLAVTYDELALSVPAEGYYEQAFTDYGYIRSQVGKSLRNETD